MNDQYREAEDGPNLNEFYDPRLVAVYDTVNPIAEYQAFYLDLASKPSAASIIDTGCGTGLLTCELARRGHRLIGVVAVGATSVINAVLVILAYEGGAGVGSAVSAIPVYRAVCPNIAEWWGDHLYELGNNVQSRKQMETMYLATH
jgi:hypothetical protein